MRLQQGFEAELSTEPSPGRGGQGARGSLAWELSPHPSCFCAPLSGGTNNSCFLGSGLAVSALFIHPSSFLLFFLPRLPLAEALAVACPCSQ